MSDHPKFITVKTAMLLHVPFFASLLLDIMTVRVGKFPGLFPEAFDDKGNPLPDITKQMATMATDGKSIYIDEDFLDRIPIESAVFGVCHEISHAMWEHMSRGKKYSDLGFDGQEFNPMLWNVATDYVINDMLEKSGCGKILRNDKGEPQWLLDPKYTCQMSGEDVYRDLLKQQKGGGGKGGKGKGQGMPGQGQGQGQFDHHIHSPADINPAELKRAIQTAADSAKAVGKLPGELARFAEDFLEAKVAWQEMLRTTVVTTAARDTTSWARPHRRRLATQGVYLARPSAYGCRLIVWVWDTSGSIGQREMNVFGGECKDIIRTCHPESVFLIGCDARVASIHEFGDQEEIDWSTTEVKGGGGTDFRPPFEWVKEQGLVPDCFIYFTDMMGPFPDQDPGYPVIWCSTTADTQGPFGKTIYVDINDTQ